MSLLILMAALTAGAGALAYPQPAAEPEETPAAAKAVVRPGNEEKIPPHRDSYGDPLPPGAIARLGTVRLRPGNLVHLLASFPDNERALSVATEEEAMVISVWRLATGELLRHFETPLEDLHYAVVSPDGKRLATRGLSKQDGVNRVRFWDVASGKQTGELTEAGHVLAMAFAPDGKTLATAGNDQTLRLWDTETLKERRRFQEPKDEWWRLAFSRDGKVLVSIGKSGTVRVWDTATGTGRDAVKLPSVPNRDFAVSADGNLLATVAGKTIRLWDLSAGRELRQLSTASPTTAFAFSPDGKILAAGGEREEGKTLIYSPISLWDVNTGRELRRLPGHLFGVNALAFSADGKRLVSGGAGNVLRVWDVATGKDLLPFAEHQSYSTPLPFRRTAGPWRPAAWTGRSACGNRSRASRPACSSAAPGRGFGALCSPRTAGRWFPGKMMAPSASGTWPRADRRASSKTPAIAPSAPSRRTAGRLPSFIRTAPSRCWMRPLARNGNGWRASPGTAASSCSPPGANGWFPCLFPVRGEMASCRSGTRSPGKNSAGGRWRNPGGTPFAPTGGRW
jgi:hypothetical protein